MVNPNNDSIRLRRSVLYMPGSNERAMDKARSLNADTIILDLEDAVAPGVKEDAREKVAENVRAGGFGQQEVLVRVNAVGTPWHEEDMDMAIAVPCDGIVLPKVEDGSTVQRVAETIADFARAAELALDAGYDGVEIMGSEGYLMSQFLAVRTNTATATGAAGSPPLGTRSPNSRPLYATTRA